MHVVMSKIRNYNVNVDIRGIDPPIMTKKKWED